MIKLFLAFVLFILTAAVHAQKRNLLIKDTAYARFKTELDGWIKKANGRNTYATEVKSLFERNKPMLARVYKQYGDPAAINDIAITNRRRTLKKPGAEVLKMMNELRIFGIETNMPITGAEPWKFCDRAPIYSSEFPLKLIHFEGDKDEFSYKVNDILAWQRDLLQSHMGYNAKIKVPDNPEIIAARIKFEYSFDYTGWDTRGGMSGIHLVLIKQGPSFQSETLISWTDTVVRLPGLYQAGTTYYIIEELLPSYSVAGEIEEVHANKQGSLSVDGFVKPNTNLEFGFGIGYKKGSVFGINGQYLYGEFRLKKATVTFYKKKPG